MLGGFSSEESFIQIQRSTDKAQSIQYHGFDALAWGDDLLGVRAECPGQPTQQGPFGLQCLQQCLGGRGLELESAIV